MLTTFHMGHWKPLTWLTHGVDFTLWGMHPLGYKAGSIALHVAAALAFLALARRLLRLAQPERPRDAVRPGPWRHLALRRAPIAGGAGGLAERAR